MFCVILFNRAHNVVFFSVRKRAILSTWSLVESMWAGELAKGETGSYHSNDSGGVLDQLSKLSS